MALCRLMKVLRNEDVGKVRVKKRMSQIEASGNLALALQAMKQDGVKAASIRVDGGMVKNNWLCAQLADILGIPVQRPVETETTALGAAMLAGLQAGLYHDLTDAGAKWKSERSFEPVISDHQREALMTN